MMSSKPVEYMARTRSYYEAQGYERFYKWSAHDATPFQPLKKPLAASNVALVTTAMPTWLGKPKRVCSESSTVNPDGFYVDDLAWDKKATHTDDLGSYFPIVQLKEAVDSGRVGNVADRYHCVPTEYSQRRTLDLDGPAIVDACLADDVDIAILVPL